MKISELEDKIKYDVMHRIEDLYGVTELLKRQVGDMQKTISELRMENTLLHEKLQKRMMNSGDSNVDIKLPEDTARRKTDNYW